MFDGASDTADERAFAERRESDRHDFRFIISPEDGAELGNLKTFTRELMLDVERDLGAKLDWAAVDHWNTEAELPICDPARTPKTRSCAGCCSAGQRSSNASAWRTRWDLPAGR